MRQAFTLYSIERKYLNELEKKISHDNSRGKPKMLMIIQLIQ